MASPYGYIRRAYRQILILIHKNLLVAWKQPLSTLIRAFVVPVVLTLILCFLKHIAPSSDSLGPTGFSNETNPILDLADAIKLSSSKRLAFVTNGITDPALQGAIDAISSEVKDTRVLSKTNELFDVCPQTVQGAGECFAAVIFNHFNNSAVNYTIAISNDIYSNFPINYNNQQSLLSCYIMPIQWSFNSQVGNLVNATKPSERIWNGYLDKAYMQSLSELQTTKQAFWLEIVHSFVAPLFVCIFVGAAYHVSTLVASERQLMDLMSAQHITSAPRILSTILSFMILYLPGLMICSILTTEILFVHTSGGVFFALTVLCGISIIIFAHLVGTFFRRPSIAGMTCSILLVCLALLTLIVTLSSNPSPGQIKGLAFIFPSAAWATLITDTAATEIAAILQSTNQSIYLSQNISTGLFFVFFVVQIFFYLALTLIVERLLWGVRRKYATLSPSEDTALRITSLSKTYGRAANPAVSNVSLKVREGAVTFLLGPNGSGKTTLLKCVTGMVSVDHGSEIALKADASLFGICPQNNIFWGPLSVKEHVQIWRKLRTAGTGSQSNDSNDDNEVVNECDLAEKTHAAARTLSGGQKRKLQLAMAFAGGSKIVFIDEATSGLDPLSRRNIWDIIQKGRNRRTTLITTHFLDEADVLADTIFVMHRGHLVCHGSSIELKHQYGNGYQVTSGEDLDNAPRWKLKTSAEATQKVLELESANQVCQVLCPTLEQVFLNVTSESNAYIGDDGFIGNEETPVNDNRDESLDTTAPHSGDPTSLGDLKLDAAKPVSMARQVWLLFRKRWLLLRSSGFFVYLVNLAIPIVVAAILYRVLLGWNTLTTCDMQRNKLLSESPLKNPFSEGAPFIGSTIAAVGPNDSFTGEVQDQIMLDTMSPIVQSTDGSADSAAILAEIVKVDDESGIVNTVKDNQGDIGFGLWSPTSQNNTFFHGATPYLVGIGASAFDYVINRMSNMSTTPPGVARIVSTNVQVFNFVPIRHNWETLPLQMLIILAFVAAVSTAVIYPTYERKSKVRALHYSNGVSPAALWTAYLLFDLQFIFIQGLIVWGLLFSGPNGARISYAPSYLLGVFILFGIASYLGTYLISMFFSRGTFGIACGVHVALTLIYLAAYAMNQYLGPDWMRQDVYTYLQNGLGLTSPGANLSRALWLSMNTFDSLCGKFGTADVSNAMAYSRYGGVYTNLILQILFTSACIAIYEYGSVEWLPWHMFRTSPRLIISKANKAQKDDEIPLRDFSSHQVATTGIREDEILQISHVTKRFGQSTASEDVSFKVSRNETMALLGGNGAGKTTLFNMIRGELRPDHGSIHVNGISVVDHPRKARIYIGVCPQDDAVDNLTVRQTLEFYAAVKGLENVHYNVDQILAALDISQFSSHAHKALSGGTKRKLTVAIALLGNPRLLLLDEPSTAQDAGAKRLLWRALKRVRKDRAILLTTHSMEEAEALASNAVIVYTRMMAIGSLQSLQELHGLFYTVRAVRLRDVDSSMVETQVRTIFARWDMDVVDYWDANGLLLFKMKYNRTMLGKIMAGMEQLTGDSRMLSAYSLIGPSLEDVFMNVTRRARDAGQA